MAFNVLGEALNSKYLTSDVFEDYIGNTLWGWGNNGTGNLGDNTITNRSSPVQTIAGGTNWRLISSNGYNTSGIKTDGTLWTWGWNAQGQLGDNTITNRSSPVQTVATGTNWKQVSFGRGHIGSIKTDGTLWLWGQNDAGQLGDNTITNRSSPVQTITGGTNWKQVSCGLNHSGAIKTDGTLWMWGKNSYPALGDGTRTNRSSPVQTVAAGNNWKLIYAGYYTSAAIKTDGTLWMWGANDQGQLGDNTVSTNGGRLNNGKSSPVQTVAGGTNWKSVCMGTPNVYAIKTDGTLWAWGRNFQGCLGDGTIVSRSSPVQTVSGGNNWKFVAAGNYSVSAIKTDGTLWLWGYNSYGQTGDNTITSYSSPVQTISGGNNWKLVTKGNYHTAAITFTDYQ
jgi:alpha-tubulin suppressor-like RCC1 family protein